MAQSKSDEDWFQSLISIPSLPSPPSWWKNPCSKFQRETMDRLRLNKRMLYVDFLLQASKLSGVEREVKRLGDFTKQEARRVIEWLKTGEVGRA